MADSTHDYPTIEQGQGGKENTANAADLSASPGRAFGLDIEASTGLHVELLEGYAPNATGVPTKVPRATFDLTDNATNYIRRNADLTYTASTSPPTGWPGPLASGAVAVFAFVATSGAVTWTDYRCAPGTGVTLAAIAAALGLTSITHVGDDLIFTDGAKSGVLTLV